MTLPTNRLDRGRVIIAVIDVQEGFRHAIDDFDAVAGATGRLVEAAGHLDIPVIVTEQYPKGLGRTVPEVSAMVPGIAPLEKTCFAASDAEGFDLRGRDQVLVCGVEAHVCVYQSVYALLEQGLSVSFVTDAIGSRAPRDRTLAMERMRQDGASATGVEMALFELLGRAGTPEFKVTQQIIR